MYRNFENILKMKKITAYKVSKETGVATTTLSEWKKGTYIPKINKIMKIANYLGVTIEELLSDDIKVEQ